MYVNTITLPAQFTPGTYTPVLDATGALVANHVTGEQQTFTSNLSGTHTFIMPSYAPFFGDTIVVSSVISGVVTPLVLGIDYLLCLPFLGASRAINTPIFGGILFTNAIYSGTIQLDYHTLGGVWVTGQVKNAHTLGAIVANPLVVTMEQVADYTSVFPVINSVWDRADSTALPALNAQIGIMEQHVATKAAAQNYNAAVSHLANQSNPHQVTLTQLGLDKVANLPPASNLQSQDINNNTSYISAAQVNSMMINGAARATATAQGVVELNMGSMLGDDTSQLKTLTAVGFSLMAANSASAIGSAINKGQIQGFVTPFPYIFPIGWNGNIYYTQAQFAQAVQTAVGVSPLEFDSDLGCFWFPANTHVPSLAVTSSH